MLLYSGIQVAKKVNCYCADCRICDRSTHTLSWLANQHDYFYEFLSLIVIFESYKFTNTLLPMSSQSEMQILTNDLHVQTYSWLCRHNRTIKVMVSRESSLLTIHYKCQSILYYNNVKSIYKTKTDVGNECITWNHDGH